MELDTDCEDSGQILKDLVQQIESFKILNDLAGSRRVLKDLEGSSRIL